MSRRIVVLFFVSALVAGCASVSNTLDALNPFSSSAPKLGPLPKLTVTADVRTLWSSSISKAGDYTFTPAIVGDRVYVASNNGSLSRIEGGRTVWKIKVGQPLSAGVGAGDRLVVVGTAKGEVLAFAPEDGKLMWQSRVSSEILASPVIGDEGVAVKSGDNQVFLLDTVSGARKWAYQRATPPLSVRSAGGPVFADRYLFVGYPGGKLVALSLQNGAPVWEGAVALPKGATELDRVADIVASPVVDGRQVCAVAFQGRVACFDMGQGGAMIWSRDMSSASGIALDGRYLYVADDKGVVHALDRQSGSTLWKQDKLKGRTLSAPVVRRGLVAVADVEGLVHFLSREDGGFQARLKTDGTSVRAPLLPWGPAILVQTSGGSITLFEAQ